MSIYKYILSFSLSSFMLFCIKGQNNDLTLEKAISIALENNYGIIISKLETGQAAINNNWGSAGRYPSISLSGYSGNAYNVTDGSSLANRINADLGLRWNLFNGFRVIITKNQLETLEELAQGRSSVIVENTIEDIILGYFMILLEKEKLSVIQEIYNLSSDRYEYELKRQELGSSVTYQVLQAKNNYLSDKVAFMSQEVTVRNAIRNLHYLMGLDSVQTWDFSQKFEADSTNFSFYDLKEKMLGNNNTIKNQYISLKLKQQDTRLQKTNLYPSLSLSTGLSNDQPYMWTNGNVNFGDNTLNVYGNVNLTYNIFTGGNRKRAVQIAKISEEIANTELKEIEHILLNQLMNIFDMYNVRKEILKVAQENMETAALNLKIAQEKYKSGVINSFNYRDIQLNYINAAIERLEAVYHLIGSHTSLVRLTGGMIEEE